MERVYIVIVTYNAMQWLEKCLLSINHKLYHVLIIDNNSTDGTVSFIKENYPAIKLFEQKENLGFGQANNVGIAYAYSEGADFIMLLNQDAYLQENTLSSLIEIANKNTEYGILSPIHLNGKGDVLDYNFSTYVVPWSCTRFYSDSLLQNYSKEVYELPFVNAAAWLLTRNCIETVGGFNPSFFHYAEDDNYCQRILYHGLKIGIVPNVYVHHDREERKSNIYFDDEEIVRDRAILKDFSNPNNTNLNLDYLFLEDKREQRKKAIRQFRFKKLKKIEKQFEFYNKIPQQTILKNRELSKKKGLTFLFLK